MAAVSLVIWTVMILWSGWRCSVEGAAVRDVGYEYGYPYRTTPPPPPITYQRIRLVGPDRCSGRVELYNQGQWGTVCDRYWYRYYHGQVVCREVGCGPAISANRGAYGEGSGPIWLHYVSCNGDEDSLSQCTARNPGHYKCSHSQDAGVTCQGGRPQPLSLHADFMVGRSGEVRGFMEPVLFNMVVSDTGSGFINTGEFGYNKDTGLYTVPFHGYFTVTVTSVLCIGNQTADWDLVVDGRTVWACNLVSGVVGVPCTRALELTKGQALSVTMRSGCVWGMTLSGTASKEFFEYPYIY